MAKKPASRKPKSDKSPEAEYQRFLETAREVEASEKRQDLDAALKNIASHQKPPDR